MRESVTMSRFDVEGYKKLAKTIKENEIENARHKRMLKDIEEGRYSINLTKDEARILNVLLFFVDPDILEDEDGTRPLRDKLHKQLTAMIS